MPESRELPHEAYSRSSDNVNPIFLKFETLNLVSVRPE